MLHYTPTIRRCRSFRQSIGRFLIHFSRRQSSRAGPGASNAYEAPPPYEPWGPLELADNVSAQELSSPDVAIPEMSADTVSELPAQCPRYFLEHEGITPLQNMDGAPWNHIQQGLGPVAAQVDFPVLDIGQRADACPSMLSGHNTHDSPPVSPETPGQSVEYAMRYPSHHCFFDGTKSPQDLVSPLASQASTQTYVAHPSEHDRFFTSSNSPTEAGPADPLATSTPNATFCDYRIAGHVHFALGPFDFDHNFVPSEQSSQEPMPNHRIVDDETSWAHLGNYSPVNAEISDDSNWLRHGNQTMDGIEDHYDNDRSLMG